MCPGITKEKMSAINMILSNKTIGWKAALRKILVVVFGIDTLSQSCAKSKKNAQNRSLDVKVMRSITGNSIFTKLRWQLIFISVILFCRYFVSEIWRKLCRPQTRSYKLRHKQCLFRSMENFERLPSMFLNIYSCIFMISWLLCCSYIVYFLFILSTIYSWNTNKIKNACKKQTHACCLCARWV